MILTPTNLFSRNNKTLSSDVVSKLCNYDHNIGTEPDGIPTFLVKEILVLLAYNTKSM